MELIKSSPQIFPIDQHCWQWARKYLKYCLCSTKDGVSLTLGLVSVLSWGVAEIPQIITNYKDKSAEGLSIAFLMTWAKDTTFEIRAKQKKGKKEIPHSNKDNGMVEMERWCAGLEVRWCGGAMAWWRWSDSVLEMVDQGCVGERSERRRGVVLEIDGGVVLC
ncbi:hypothetical protein LguiA_012438 [Lonicera macranthoides]